MRTVRPHHLVTYSRCPRRALHSLGTSTEPDSFHFSVVKQTIQASYIHAYNRQKYPKWRRVLEILNRLVRNEGTAMYRQEVYQQSHNMMVAVDRWYEKYFCKDYRQLGLSNVPVEFPVGSSLTYRDDIPLVLFGDTIKICDFKEVSNIHTVSKMATYNDMLLQVRAWGANHALDIPPSHYARIYISDKSVSIMEIQITQEMLAKSDKMLKYILTGMRNEAWHPVPSAQCQACPFSKGCTF